MTTESRENINSLIEVSGEFLSAWQVTAKECRLLLDISQRVAKQSELIEDAQTKEEEQEILEAALKSGFSINLDELKAAVDRAQWAQGELERLATVD